MQVFRTDENGIWTGDSRQIGPKDGWQRNEIHHAPPVLSEGQFAQWRGHVWVVLNDYPIEPLKNDKLARLATKRWEVETNGITLNDMFIATDDRSKALIYGAKGREVSSFKISTGTFISLTSEQTSAIAEAVSNHVQACFDREKELTALIITAENSEELNSIDINAGWPE